MIYLRGKLKKMMTNRPIIIDYDGTLVNSQKAVCEVYNRMFKDHPDFTPADWTKIKTWSFRDQCTLLNDEFTVTDIFGMKEFFNVVEFYDGAKEILEKLSKETEVYICTAGTPSNISHKVLWIEKHLPFAHIIPVIINGSNGVGKKIVNMEGAIFIDDHEYNLIESNADVKLVFGEVLPWNENFHGIRIREWNDTAYELIKHLM